jgi:hypothetical protein
MQNKIFIWIAIATVLILAVPLLLMLLQIPLPDPGDTPSALDWSFFDFLLMGLLLSGTGSVFVFLARMIQNTSHRVAIAVCLVFAFLWLWAELAVGVFTNWGS